MSGNRASTFHDVAQGIFAISGIVALVVAAGLYFTERRNMPRMVIAPSAIVLGAAGGRQRPSVQSNEVLVQFTARIENRSTRGDWFRCAALDVIGLEGDESRANPFPDDMQGESLLPASPQDDLWANCVNRFEVERRALGRMRIEEDQRWVNSPALTDSPLTGARYRDFFMEPGEVVTKTWEQRVPCRFRAVRIIFKLPKPGQNSWLEYETKLLVPIADVCRGRRLVATYPARD